MKVAILVVGIVLLLVGLVGALWCFFVASGAETAYAFFCPGGSMPPEVCNSFLATASTYRTLAFVLGIFGASGLALTIAGAAIKGPAPPLTMPMPQPVPPPMTGATRPCSRCGAANTWADRFCAKCGSPL